MIVMLGLIFGAIVGLAIDAVWWAVSTLAGWPTPTDLQAIAVIILTAAPTTLAAFVAFVLWD